MEEGLPYYDWNTGKALQPWAWLWDDDEDEEPWEFSIDSHVMTMDSMTFESRSTPPKSIRIPVDNSSKPVDKLCKNSKIIVIKKR